MLDVLSQVLHHAPSVQAVMPYLILVSPLRPPGNSSAASFTSW